MKKLVLATMGCAALLATTVSHAEIKPIFSAGLTFGGEDMYTTTYSGASSSESVRAGGFYQFSGGALFGADGGVQLQTTIGVHRDDESKAAFVRYPLETIAFVQPSENWRIGAGARVVITPKFTADYTTATSTVTQHVNYKTTPGLVLETGYRMHPNAWINFRGVYEKYKVKNAAITGLADDDKSGAHVGVNLLLVF